MGWLTNKIGFFLDLMAGPRTTHVFEGNTHYQVEKLRPTFVTTEVEVGITSTRIIYRTKYKRWWMPDKYRCVFEVRAYAPEDMRARLDPRLFETHHYPGLCNHLVESTKLGHYYAIHAFLDRLAPQRPHREIPL